jgi:IS5 family transposase
MRQKRESVLAVRWNDEGLPLPVRVYRAKYQAISQVLDRNPEILDRVHDDLRKLSQGGRRGREGDYTSENILRALLVQSIEGLSFRDAVVRIADSEFLQTFLRMQKKSVMDHSFLNKCFKAVQPETWKAVNELLSQDAVRRDLIDPTTIRTDTTVVETNIHYPTDSSLLWDAWRVASRWLRRAREIEPACCRHRFHNRKIKRLYLFIARYAISKSKPRQRQVKAAFHKLIERVQWIVEIAGEFCAAARSSSNLDLAGVALELQTFVPTPEKFITDYEVYERQQADCALTESVIRRHEALFGARPEVLVGDMGFCPTAEKFEELEELVGTLAIPRRLRDFANKMLAKWQAFRAGIEGTISGLKRVFRLFRCYFRGFKSFASGVGLGVFCHNLIVLAGSS